MPIFVTRRLITALLIGLIAAAPSAASTALSKQGPTFGELRWLGALQTKAEALLDLVFKAKVGTVGDPSGGSNLLHPPPPAPTSTAPTLPSKPKVGPVGDPDGR